MLDFLNDDSQEIREEILKHFSVYGEFLETDLKEFSAILTEPQQILLNPIIEENRRKWLEKNWFNVSIEINALVKIETALDLIAKFQYGLTNNRNLSDWLSIIAEEFKNKIPYGDEHDLAAFLFQELGIKGDHNNYYNQFNSNAVFAIQEKKGNPITLCIIYCLVGNRLGFNIVGCNFPGHFLAKVVKEDGYYLVDCFNGGKVIYDSDIAELAKDSSDSIIYIIKENASAEIIIRRVLSNLSQAYSIINQLENMELFTRLAKMI